MILIGRSTTGEPMLSDTSSGSSHPYKVALILLVCFHILVIASSNFLVQLPIHFWGVNTTWGAFSFPFIFISTDLTVRLLGKHNARILIAWVMLPALLLSYIVSVVWQQASFRGFDALLHWNMFVGRIALASFSAYVFGQLLDITVFDKLRQMKQWWIAPTASTIFGMLIDTLSFFAIAFYHSPDAFMSAHWFEIGMVDYSIKLIIGLIFFIPLYGVLLNAILKIMRKTA